MTPSRDDIIRMAREAGYPHVGPQWNDQELAFLERFAALVDAHAWALKPPPAIVVKTADLDPALLRDMLAKAPPMHLLPMPPDAALDSERAARVAAQTEAVELKERLARSGVEERRAVAAEREACAQVADATFSGKPGQAVNLAVAAAIRARSKP